MNHIAGCEHIELSVITDTRGSLTFVEGRQHIPFPIRHVEWTSPPRVVPAPDGGHAHVGVSEVLIPLRGGVVVEVMAGAESCRSSLTRPHHALHIPPGMTRTVSGHSDDAVLLRLASATHRDGGGPRPLAPARPRRTVDDCRLLEFPRDTDGAGTATCCSGDSDVPFPVARVFYLYDVASGQDRGAHAHRLCDQVLICPAGSFEVLMDDGSREKTVRLTETSGGLYVPAGIWAVERDFEPGSVCLVLASRIFEAHDYIRSYDEFLATVQAG